MKNLEALINQAKVAYYNGSPFIADEVYDRLLEQYEISESVGMQSSDNRYPHAYRMYSLQKVYTGDTAPYYDGEAVVVTPKLDGAAVSLQYIRGQLSLALTRGDGKLGMNITDKMKYIVPNEIWNEVAENTKMMQITGELVAPTTIENARNYAAGALNLKDIEEFKSRDLTFIAYGVQPYPTDNYVEDLELLSQWGFETAIDSDYTEFPQDGDVWRVIDNGYFEKLGYTSHHPRASFAKKKRQKGVETTLLDVVWQVGKSGCVSPVGILEPIKIGDATVSRVTLHNMAIIDALGLEIGCQVEVIRAGEIIPQIVSRID
jgi:DNA ligase (NAD+)